MTSGLSTLSSSAIKNDIIIRSWCGYKAGEGHDTSRLMNVIVNDDICGPHEAPYLNFIFFTCISGGFRGV